MHAPNRPRNASGRPAATVMVHPAPRLSARRGSERDASHDRRSNRRRGTAAARTRHEHGTNAPQKKSSPPEHSGGDETDERGTISPSRRTVRGIRRLSGGWPDPQPQRRSDSLLRLLGGFGRLRRERLVHLDDEVREDVHVVDEGVVGRIVGVEVGVHVAV